LAVTSAVSTNFVQRDRLRKAAGAWFAASGDATLKEGDLPPQDAWEKRVAAWSGRIGNVDSLARHPDLMERCVYLGTTHGLDAALFEQHAPPPPPPPDPPADEEEVEATPDA
jgi:hypothetical protein